MARLVKSVYVHAPVRRAHDAWQRFARHGERRQADEYSTETVRFIPAEGGCVVACVVECRPFPGPLGRLFGTASKLQEELEGFKRLVESAAEGTEEAGVADGASLASA